jgi:hypothetical protein
MGLDPLRAATLGTKEDAEYPVEKLARGTRVNGIRVELATDLIEVPGSWVVIGSILVEARYIVVADPAHVQKKQMIDLDKATGTSDIDLAFTNGIVHGCAIRAAPGRWRVEVFKNEAGDELGLRLLRLTEGSTSS